MRGGTRLATVMVAAALPAMAAGAPPVLDQLRVVDVRGGQAVVLRLSHGLVPVVVPVRGGDGRLRRLHLDLPRGTRIAQGMARTVTGGGPVNRARLGVVGDDRLRLVVDVADAGAFVVRTTDEGRRVSIAVGDAPQGSPDRIVRPAQIEPRPRPTAGAAVDVTRAESPASSARVSGGRRVRVVLDAGHGGDDPGAIGYVVEKHVTLDVVRRLARRLREDLRAEVILTRSSDATIPLTERTAIANQAGADLFVSVHANANPNGRSKGIETYVLDDTTDRATLRLAAIENGTGRERYRAQPTDLRYILSSLVQGGKMPDSSRLAGAVHREVLTYMRARYPDIEDLGVKRGPFYVLVGSHMPCVLIETAFVNHPLEGRRLADEAYRVALADGMARGIKRFLEERRRAQTL